MASSRRCLRLVADLGRDAVGAVEQGRAGRDFIERLDEDGSALAEAIDDVLVVNDLVIHVERRTEEIEARSRHSIAMLTPAQKPRGLASRIFISRHPLPNLKY